MAKLSDDLEKVTLNLFEGDMARIRDMYPDVGASVIIRRIVRNFIQAAEPKAETLKAPNVDL